MRLFLYICLLSVSINSFADETNFSDWVCESYYDEYFNKNVICREKWGAQLAKNDMVKDPNKIKFAIHHSAGSSVSSGTTVKNIQQAHMHDKKWSDIGYHFLIGRDGKCFEGRELEWQGAHVEGDNKGNVGVCFLGCFDDNEPNFVQPTRQMINKAGELIGVLSYKYGINLVSSAIKGHRQHKNAKTVCPGNRLMECMDDILIEAQETKNRIGH